MMTVFWLGGGGIEVEADVLDRPQIRIAEAAPWVKEIRARAASGTSIVTNCFHDEFVQEFVESLSLP